ncbi:MAG: 50S ribosomal protein L25/general stress protein Ctc [Xanthomonadales bacterium]|nr:50S ribosomal protein L25/general stress protein Ctc [Xanthomonadales bacterium]NIN59153.1 50S ribosomal protein L25/general stress protein Ctc [Xanthomonadales bacterium]NIN74464.1 50S ribosomal protein L25/general stress protein Ctc [Xanthomonadales bacterium]NIO13267.1 50S ribosomal protein L25/general stress protein Ctc [Xanthomonadales bacterium]NIP11546.1 50S ribosomal protein L25/general stress protein Ctc [Xanthomonadales bacterium]
MSDNQAITAEIRTDKGKGASRRLRREGRIPAVLYGGGDEPVALTLAQREIQHAAQKESFYSSIQEIRLADGRSQQVVVRDLQRHPFKTQILHLDFQRVSAAEVLRILVPLHFVGEQDSPAGKTSGVVIQHQVTEVEIAALPKDLPEFLEVDLSFMEPGAAVMLSEVRLPEGVEIPALAVSKDGDTMVANAIHISESQGTGAAAAAEAEAEALAEIEGEALEEAPAEEGEEPQEKPAAGDEAEE